MPTKKKKTVLVAEDDKFLLKVYKVKLAKEGYDAIATSNGEEAIDALDKNKHIDIVLLDIVMPKRSGLEVLEYMKSKDELKDIPAVVFSNLGQDGDIKKGLQAGANDYVIKSNMPLTGVIDKIKKYT